MLDLFSSTRHRIFSAILFFYFLPVIFLTIYNALKAPIHHGWGILSLGMLFATLGSLVLFMMMRDWESRFLIYPKNPSPPDGPIELANNSTASEGNLLEDALTRCQSAEELLVELKQEEKLLQEELVKERNEVLNVTKEKEKLQFDAERLMQEFNLFRESSEEKLEQNHIFLGEYQQTINEQRGIIEAKQQQVDQLEGKVRDLTYEIKTLLQLAERAEGNENKRPARPHGEGYSRQLQSPEILDIKGEEARIEPVPEIHVTNDTEAISQLKRCIEIAEKITGTTLYANRVSKIGDLPMENSALDLRRLYHSLRSESGSVILLFSKKENKLLFVNNRIKDLLGWVPDKFIQNFSDIVGEDFESWNQILSQLAYKNEGRARLSLRAKSGEAMMTNIHLGVIPSGLFRGHIMGVLY